mmetsp:Transcript_18317/g.21179  ORF Transcript_18317/g.21179 Transcript_18317/m.21179 type:complete len:251 (-) Transcript_18317:200-952(-)
METGTSQPDAPVPPAVPVSQDTPNNKETGDKDNSLSLLQPNSAAGEKSQETQSENAKKSSVSETTPPKKRKKPRGDNYHFRPTKKGKRLFWTQKEVDALIRATATIGPGKWTKIKLAYPEIFQNRTTLDLKDKWRNIERRPETNKRAKISRAKLKASTEAKTGGVETMVLTITCKDSGKLSKIDACQPVSSSVMELYKWVASKFYTDSPEYLFSRMEILTPNDVVVERSKKSLKETGILKDGMNLTVRRR